MHAMDDIGKWRGVRPDLKILYLDIPKERFVLAME
jgi:hypothetical protein